MSSRFPARSAFDSFPLPSPANIYGRGHTGTVQRVASTPVATPMQPATGALAAERARVKMVQYLAASGIRSPAVLDAMGTVPRHQFVQSALASQAYEDTSLPIGHGQTISKPSIVATMLELLFARNTVIEGRILDIGTGCAYQACVLAHLAREVYSMERIQALHLLARKNLHPLRISNLHLILGDGMLGYPKGAPYTGIISAAGGSHVPKAWLEQLAPGGRLVAPTQQEDGTQALVVMDKSPDGASVVQEIHGMVHFVPLKSRVLRQTS